MEKTTKKAVFLGQEKQKQEKVRHCNRCTLSQFKTKKSGKYTTKPYKKTRIVNIITS